MINLFKLFRPARDYSPDDEPLQILNDTVFKAMLASDTEDSREALKSLLCACTGREITDVKSSTANYCRRTWTRNSRA